MEAVFNTNSLFEMEIKTHNDVDR